MLLSGKRVLVRSQCRSLAICFVESPRELRIGVLHTAVQHIDRYSETLRQMAAFVSDIKSVESVEVAEAVVAPEQDRLPWLMTQLVRIGGRRLDDNDLRPEAPPIRGANDGFFVALDIDLEKVDQLAGGVLRQDVGERRAGDLMANPLGDPGFQRIGKLLLERRGAGVLGMLVQRDMPTMVANGHVEIDVPRALRRQAGKYRSGLDIDAHPAAIIEMLGEGADDGVVGPDVDVETTL